MEECQQSQFLNFLHYIFQNEEIDYSYSLCPHCVRVGLLL